MSRLTNLSLQLFFYLGLFNLASPSFCLADEFAERLLHISETTMSPFCPGRTLSSCPSPQAKDLRDQISTWITSGYTDEAVLLELEKIYGKDVKGIPDNTGIGIFSWAAPVVFLIFGGLVVFWVLRRMKNSPVNASPVN